MRVGIDIHFCRFTRTGIYTYLWNLLDALPDLHDAPEVTLLLYGQPWVPEPAQIARMHEAFATAKLEYFWDDVPLWLASDVGTGGAPEGWRRQLDRHVMRRLWRSLMRSRSLPMRAAARGLRAWQRSRSTFGHDLDLVHHPAGLLLPLHPRTNVMTVNDLIPHHFAETYRWESEWFGEAFASARDMDIVITYSEHTKRDVVAALGVAPERVRVIPLAPHASFRPIGDRHVLDAVRARYALRPRYIAHLGHMEPRKNLGRLVQAYAELRRGDRPIPHQLVLIGPGYKDFEPVWGPVARHGLEADVIWLGEVPFDDLAPLLSGAEVLACPSLYEGFGLPPLEAMACGTPVVVANATSLPEVVGDAGLLFDAESVDSIARALRTVLDDDALRARLSAQCLERARTFTWQATARATVDAYRDAIASSRAGAAVMGRQRTVSDLKSRNHQIVREWLVGRVFEEL